MSEVIAKDVFGNEIREGDRYLIVNGHVVHEEAIEDYLIEKLRARFFKAKKLNHFNSEE